MANTTFAIDRFEGDIAVLVDEAGKTVQIAKKDLPPGCQEGEVLRHDGKSWHKDAAETAKRKDAIRQRMKNLIRRG